MTDLEATMTRMGDRLSYPYWSTREILWNGQPVTVSAPQPINQTDEE